MKYSSINADHTYSLIPYGFKVQFSDGLFFLSREAV